MSDEKNLKTQIRDIRGHRVMLDNDLARLYGVETGALKRAVRRNPKRFPEDFMFQLTWDEFRALFPPKHGPQLLVKNGKPQLEIRGGKPVNIIGRRGGRRDRPFAFTEQGVAMLSGVLKSKRAIQANISIMRAFVQIRRLALTHAELSRRLAEVEKQVAAQGRKLGDHGEGIKVILGAVRKLLTASPPKPKKQIGFRKKS